MRESNVKSITHFPSCAFEKSNAANRMGAASLGNDRSSSMKRKKKYVSERAEHRAEPPMPRR